MKISFFPFAFSRISPLLFFFSLLPPFLAATRNHAYHLVLSLLKLQGLPTVIRTTTQITTQSNPLLSSIPATTLLLIGFPTAEIHQTQICSDARTLIPINEFRFTQTDVLELNVSTFSISNAIYLDLSQFAFFLILLLIGSTSVEIRSMQISSDTRPVIPFDEFGFTHVGSFKLNVSSISFLNSQSLTHPLFPADDMPDSDEPMAARSIHIAYPDRNHQLKSNNSIRTTKYNVFTFIPRDLYEQFRRVAYLYFFILACLNQIPQLNTGGASTAFVPFGIVLFFTLVKDGYEDYLRGKSDKDQNERSCLVLDPVSKTFQSKQWKDVRIGEIVKVRKNETIPCDMVVLSTSDFATGSAYVQTINMDGESNLKTKYALHQFAEWEIERWLDLNPVAVVKCESPNRDIIRFQASILIEDREVSLGMNNVILRGCEIKNMEWVFGVAAYTGMETKIMFDSSDAPFNEALKVFDKMAHSKLVVTYSLDSSFTTLSPININHGQVADDLLASSVIVLSPLISTLYHNYINFSFNTHHINLYNIDQYILKFFSISFVKLSVPVASNIHQLSTNITLFFPKTKIVTITKYNEIYFDNNIDIAIFVISTSNIATTTRCSVHSFRFVIDLIRSHFSFDTIDFSPHKSFLISPYIVTFSSLIAQPDDNFHYAISVHARNSNLDILSFPHTNLLFTFNNNNPTSYIPSSPSPTTSIASFSP